MANAANAKRFPQTILAQQKLGQGPQKTVVGKSPQLYSGTQRAIEKVLEESLRKIGIAPQFRQDNEPKNLLKICCQIQPGTGLVLMLEIRTFYSQIWAQDLHQMLNKSRYLQRLNGDLESHLPTHVLRLMTSIFGCHWYDSILCSCNVHLNVRWPFRPHSSEAQPISAIWATRKEMGTVLQKIGLHFSRPFSTDSVPISAHQRHKVGR